MSNYASQYDVKYIEQHLNMLNPQSNPLKARHYLAMAMKLIHTKSSQDMVQVLPEVTKYLSSHDLICKKLAMWCVSSYSGQPDLLLMAVNSLMKDCSHPNPVTRCLALKTLTQIPQIEFVEYSLKAVLKALGDNSGYVRRAAVISCLKLYKLNPSVIDDHNIVDLLYGLIRDKDHIVVLNCLQVLDEILKSEGGIAINKNIAFYLLNNLKEFPDWGIPILFEFLGKYEPENEDEVYNIMNLIDGYLQKGSAATVVKSINLLLKLISGMPNIKHDVLSHAKDPLLHFINTGNPELTTSLLEYVADLYLPDYVDELQTSYTLFLCKQKEPGFVKSKRIEILFQIVNESNIQDILDELILYSSTPELCKISIDAISKIGTKSEGFHDLTTKKLLQMLDVGSELIKTEVFTILSDMNISKMDSDVVDNLIEQIGNALETNFVRENEHVLTSLFCLVGECGERLEEMPYIIEQFFEEFTFWSNTDLCSIIIEAVVKLFLKRPAEFQAILGQIFEKCNENCGIGVNETIVYYYNLLKQENSLALKTIL